MVRDSSLSYKIDHAIEIKNFLNPEEQQNPIHGSKVTADLLKGWILPIGGASAVEGLQSTGLPRLVPKYITLKPILSFNLFETKYVIIVNVVNFVIIVRQKS